MQLLRALVGFLCAVGTSVAFGQPASLKAVVPAMTWTGFKHLQYNPPEVPGHTHFGIDIGALCGKDIYPLASGDVVKIANEPKTLGHAIMLRHPKMGKNGNDLYTIYLHMPSPPNVNGRTLAVGDFVRVTEPIGKIGDTGFASGCHTHFEIRNFYYPSAAGGGWYHPNSMKCGTQSLNIYACGDQHSASWALNDWEDPATYVALCGVSNTTCQMNIVGDIAWFPAIDDCAKASQWFIVTKDTNGEYVRIGSASPAYCPLACVP